MHNDTCKTVIGKHWNEIGSIDWEGHFPILDAKLRVVRVEFIDNIEDDEDYSPVLINDHGDPIVVMRGDNDDTDAYMTHADIACAWGSRFPVIDLCENPGTEEKVDQNFPLYAESGCIVSHFAIIDRDFYFANREAIDRELVQHATDQADREYFVPADGEPVGISIVDGKGLLATFDWNGERVQSLVGMIDREPGEGDDFDPITDRPFVRPEPSRDVCILMDRDLVADLKRAAKWAQEECDRLAEEASRRPDDARAFEAHASAFDRLVSILCNATK